MAKDKVISGDYLGKSCFISGGHLSIINAENDGNNLQLSKLRVKSYEVVDADERKSGTSAVLRAGAGALLLGPVGLLAGVTAKKKGIYLVAVEFKDGKRSLIEINEKSYKQFIKDMF